MNLKLMSVAMGVALSAAFAQEAEETSAAPAEETAAVEEAPAAEQTAEPAQAAEPAPEAQAPAAEEPAAAPAELALDAVTDTAKANFDVLRGRAYNTVGNQAAASTIADNIGKPHEMHGSKFVYLEPTLEYAAVAFGENNTYFASFQNQYNIGMLTAGFATGAFGAEVYASIGKTWEFGDENGTANDYSVANVDAGDLIGAVYSMPLGNLDLTVRAQWLTINDETSTSTGKKAEDEEDYWEASLTATVSNTPAKTKLFSWAAGATVLRHNMTETQVDDDGDETDYAALDSRWQITPFFNAGKAVLNANNARVFIGAYAELPIQIYDDIANDAVTTREDHFAMGLYISPNILAELALSDNWMVFGGASYDWKVFATEFLYEDETDITAMGMASGRVAVNAGARFQYKNIALEAAIADNFFSNPLGGFYGNTILGTFGAFINF